MTMWTSEIGVHMAVHMDATPPYSWDQNFVKFSTYGSPEGSNPTEKNLLPGPVGFLCAV